MQDCTQQRIMDPLHAVVALELNDAFLAVLDALSVPTDEQALQKCRSAP
jgi:hypothetical protein